MEKNPLNISQGDRGSSLVEYSMLIALIAVVSIVALRPLGIYALDNFVLASAAMAGNFDP